MARKKKTKLLRSELRKNQIDRKELIKIKKDLQNKPFGYILDYLYCSPYSKFEILKKDKSFLDELEEQCTPKGFRAFKKVFNGYGKILKKCQEKGESRPIMEFGVNGEIAIDGKTRSECEKEYQLKNKTMKSCISFNDIVQLNCTYTHIPDDSKGKVADVYPPSSGNDKSIEYLVEIPIYTIDDELIKVEMVVLPSTSLKLLKRWNEKKNKYVEEDLEREVLTFNDYSKGPDNQYGEHRFAKKQITLASSGRESPANE